MKCLCGQKMKRPPLPFDIWGQTLWECDSCGAVMKQVFRGDPEKWTFIFWHILYLFGVHKKWWINAPEGEGTMYRLVRRSDGAVLQICEGDFQEFLREKYGGYFAVKTKEGILSGAARYDAYWEEFEEGDGNDAN